MTLEERFFRWLRTFTEDVSKPKRLCHTCFLKGAKRDALYYAFEDKGPCGECGTEIESRDSIAVRV